MSIFCVPLKEIVLSVKGMDRLLIAYRLKTLFGNISLNISKQVLLLVYDNVEKCGESNKTSARVISSDYVKLPSSWWKNENEATKRINPFAFLHSQVDQVSILSTGAVFNPSIRYVVTEAKVHVVFPLWMICLAMVAYLVVRICDASVWGCVFESWYSHNVLRLQNIKFATFPCKKMLWSKHTPSVVNKIFLIKST